MIVREDILSMEYLKKTEFTGCCQGMRYRLEGIAGEDGKRLLVHVWPEPFNFVKTPEKEKLKKEFDFSEEGVIQAVDWMNERYREDPERYQQSFQNWTSYKME